MAALRPDKLREIAELAIRPFFDKTLEARIEAAKQAWRDRVEEEVGQDTRLTKIRAEMSAALQRLGNAADTLHTLQRQAEMDFEQVSPPPFSMPTAQITQIPPRPLFSTDDDYVTATRRLRSHKSLDGPQE